MTRDQATSKVHFNITKRSCSTILELFSCIVCLFERKFIDQRCKIDIFMPASGHNEFKFSIFCSEFRFIFFLYIFLGDEEIMSKSLQIQSKRFYIDLKSNRRGKYIKISEVSERKKFQPASAIQNGELVL